MEYDKLNKSLIELLNNKKVLEKWNLIMFPGATSKAVAEWICIGLSLELLEDTQKRELFCERLGKPIQKLLENT